MQTINILISVKFHIWTRVKYRNFDINNQKYFILITFIFLVFFFDNFHNLQIHMIQNMYFDICHSLWRIEKFPYFT